MKFFVFSLKILENEERSNVFQASTSSPPKFAGLVGGLTDRNINVKDLQTSRKPAERAQNHGQTKSGKSEGISLDSIGLNELNRRSLDGDGGYNDEHEGGHHNPAFNDSSEQMDEDSEDNSDTNCWTKIDVNYFKHDKPNKKTHVTNSVNRW